ncbi:MAG: thymidine phosphorylase, partial [Coriobacteriales bacterium]|nr:thymidine phosphorylase [Coriobacteriales bacterium]
DLSSIPGTKVDKHSTGGVGDKTTLAVVPLVASLGVPVAKMSGRGLGHTGGTLDKLESIPGLSVQIERERFLDIVRSVGCSVVGQTADLVPADKKLYALRDVTATIECIPLIASSVMSKKIAAGADAIVLDVKYGSGAFMKTADEAIALAQAMVEIGEHVGRRTVALITNMDQPLGHAVGNALEVMEAADVLKGAAPDDISEICLELATQMLVLAGKGDAGFCRQRVQAQIANGAGLAKLCEMVEAQGGDSSVLHDYSGFAQAPYSLELRAEQAGWIERMDTERVGVAACELGAGRERMDDKIDPAAGIVLARKTGEYVEAGDLLATLYSSSERRLGEGSKLLSGAYEWGTKAPAEKPHLLARVSARGVEYVA